MANIFNSIPLSRVKRSKFNLSHLNKLTCDMGTLVPFTVQEVLPNDRFRVKTSQLIRFAPMIAPIMSEIDCYVHFFFVPHRIAWQGWEDFITGSHKGKMLSDDELPQKPVLRLNQSTIFSDAQGAPDGRFQPRSLMDYLGFQTFNPSDRAPGGQSLDYDVDLMPFMSYYKIWYDYYRDENLENVTDDDEISEMSGVFDFSPTDPNYTKLLQVLSLRRRAWRKDYFTSALPFAQKGDDVLIPGQDSDPISFRSGTIRTSSYMEGVGEFTSQGPTGTILPVSFNPTGPDANTGHLRLASPGFNLNLKPLYQDFDPSSLNAFIESGQASAATIRELRRAMAAQKFLERRAVGGSRYIEQNYAMFGAKSSDGRLQRAEFLGGSKQPVVISQVLQQSQTTDSSPQANPAGTAVSSGGKFIFDRTFEEYGYIIGILSVIPRADYITGIPRKYLRESPYDYYWPQFAHIGEQPIYNKELYMAIAGNPDNNMGTFGYTPRYAEYRHNRNEVHGDFRDSLKFWTLARDFSDTQRLNAAFIQCDPSNRVFAVQDTDYSNLWVELAVEIHALRPIPKYSENL